MIYISRLSLRIISSNIILIIYILKPQEELTERPVDRSHVLSNYILEHQGALIKVWPVPTKIIN